MFLLVTLQNDSTTVVYKYDDLSAALAAFHAELAYRGEGRTSTMCAILNRAGEVIRKERWEVEETEPKVEETEPTTDEEEETTEE